MMLQTFLYWPVLLRRKPLCHLYITWPSVGDNVDHNIDHSVDDSVDHNADHSFKDKDYEDLEDWSFMSNWRWT